MKKLVFLFFIILAGWIITSHPAKKLKKYRFLKPAPAEVVKKAEPKPVGYNFKETRTITKDGKQLKVKHWVDEYGYIHQK